MTTIMSYSQITKPCIIYLKSGEVITDMRGTYNKTDFKYYKKVGNRYNKIKFEKIDSVSIVEEYGNKTLLRFLPVIDEKKIQVVEQSVLGKLELYRKFEVRNNYQYYNYYLRYNNQDKLTIIKDKNFGRESKKKEILYQFINDCPELIKRIDEGEFTVSKDLSTIVSIYNITCAVNKN